MAQLVSLILIRWIVIYPTDSAIQRLNNLGQTSKIHARFQTWPLGKNYVIITKIKQKTSSNAFEFAYFVLIHLAFKR